MISTLGLVVPVRLLVVMVVVKTTMATMRLSSSANNLLWRGLTRPTSCGSATTGNDMNTATTLLKRSLVTLSSTASTTTSALPFHQTLTSISTTTSLRKNGTSTGMRSFSAGTFPPLGVNAIPQYTVFGETCMLGFKVIMPEFRLLKSNTLVVDKSKHGKVMMEWLPRNGEGV